jgi:hypothetical protein
LSFGSIGHGRCLVGLLQCSTHFSGTRVTLIAILRHCLLQDHVDFRCHCNIHLAGRSQGIHLTIYESRRACQSIRRFDTSNQVIKRSGQRIEITARVRPQPLDLF